MTDPENLFRPRGQQCRSCLRRSLYDWHLGPSYALRSFGGRNIDPCAHLCPHGIWISWTVDLAQKARCHSGDEGDQEDPTAADMDIEEVPTEDNLEETDNVQLDD